MMVENKKGLLGLERDKGNGFFVIYRISLIVYKCRIEGTEADLYIFVSWQQTRSSYMKTRNATYSTNSQNKSCTAV